jgi:hypothetical protein
MRFGTFLTSELLHHNAALRATAETRGSLAVFLATLGEVRVVGSPPPRMRAEKITAVTGALFETPTRTDPAEHRESCHATLGQLHKEFVDAVRTDLGRGRRRWHLSSAERELRWQLWRPSGWPGPDAAELLKASTQDKAVPGAGEHPTCR